MAPIESPLAPGRLARKRLAARAALWFEQIWPAVWPAVGLLGLYICVTLIDLPARLPPWPRLLLLAAILIAAAALLALGLRRVVPPDAAMADRRLERKSGLRHRPLAALSDRPAGATPEQEALWREHLNRQRAQIDRLRVGAPRPGLAARDTWALRGFLLVLLAAGVAIAGPDAPGRLWRGFTPPLPTGAMGAPTQVQAWATPPAYTGLPPVVLRADAPAPRVPAGSHVTVSVSGGFGTPDLVFDDAAEPFKPLDDKSWQAERDLPEGGAGPHRLTIRRRGGALVAWALTLIPDQAPEVTFTEPPGPNVAGGRRTTQSRFAWEAVDDYGVASLQVELRLRDRSEAPPLVIAAPVGGTPKKAHGVTVSDLTPHPWAGLPVIAQLIAKDEPGHVGRSDKLEFVLPERTFLNPVARTLIAVRRQLSLMPEERRAARAVVDGVAADPDSVDNSIGILLNLRALSSLLQRGVEPGAVDEAQQRLWDIALALEEGAAERTAQALEQARQALRDALDPDRQPQADKEEIDRRMQELREAIQRRLQALSDQARRDQGETPFDPSLPQMDARELDRRAEQLQQALREGKTPDAKQQLSELERMLDQLQNARPETREERERRRAERRQQGREQTDAVQDLVQREGKLLDQSERRAGQSDPQQARPGQSQDQGQGQQGAPSANAEQDRQGDAKRQQAMRRALGELMQRFGDLSGDVPAPLGEADQAMREAGQALQQGRDSAAGAAARRAIEALQRGGQQMSQQLARQFGNGQQEGDEGEQGADGENGMSAGGNDNRDGMTAGPRPGDRGNGRGRSAEQDPLGRPLHQGTSGAADAEDVRVPDEMEQARTREIQGELRRRGAERTRPQPELDYIDRLLNPF